MVMKETSYIPGVSGWKKESLVEKSVFDKEGGHYNIFAAQNEMEWAMLTNIFEPLNWQADKMNFILFSTSGVHGTYTTIEDIEKSAEKYGWNVKDNFDADDYCSPYLTFLIVHPRIVNMRFGEIKVRPFMLEKLKKLRKSSIEVVQKIGF